MKNRTVYVGAWTPSTMLGTALIVLKLCDVIDWHWVWVLAPFWIMPALILLGGLLFIILAWPVQR